MLTVRPLKPKKCKQCREIFQPMRPLQSVCGYACSLKFAVKLADKSDALRRKQERIELREKKIKLKSRQEWLKDVQTWFNRYIRVRDKNERCISCGQGTGAKLNAGHYRTIGACPQLRFNELNCHAQCEHCNSWLSGNIVEYRGRLIQKIGLHKVEWLEGKHELKHYTIPELMEMKKMYQGKIKEMQNEK